MTQEPKTSAKPRRRAAPHMRADAAGRKPPAIVVGFDSEWTKGARVGASLPSDRNAILSYQLCVLNRDSGESHTVIVYPRGPNLRDRFTLRLLLLRALNSAKGAGVIDAWPETIALGGFFLRADLSTLADWRTLKSSVDSVRGTFATTTRPLARMFGRHRTTIYVVDAKLLAPAGSSLKSLGASIGVEKIDLPPGMIEKMDELLRDDPQLFERYAKQDAIVAAAYIHRAWAVLGEKFGVGEPKPTLGSVAVAMIKKEIVRLGVEPRAYFGYTRKKGFKGWHWLESLTRIVPEASNCYHGGRNEAFRLGLTPPGVKLYDLDVRSAYTSAMAMILTPDWASTRPTTDIGELAIVDAAMTFAEVAFRFPSDTRFPSLPVRAGDRGLVYPLSGVSFCTGAELVVARAHGARIDVVAGWRVDWAPASKSPFEAFTRNINRIRAEAKAARDVMLDKLAKEIGNSGYGKVAQAVALTRTIRDHGVETVIGKRVFDAREGEMKSLPPSAITNPMMAAFTTGLVRALVSEALAAMPHHPVVCSVTTDGFLSSLSVGDVDQTGPVARAFVAARKRITPDDTTIWEEKHRVGRALVVKTRGTFTVEPFDLDSPGEPVLARAGCKLENPPADKWAECAEWRRVYAERRYDTFHKRSSLTPLRTQWVRDGDLTEVETETRVNLDFDLKRRIVDPVDVEGLICAETRPWNSVDDFGEHRDGLEDWKRSRRRVLKTSADFGDMAAWNAARPGQRAAGSTSQSGRPPLVNAFMKAVTRGVIDKGVWTPHKRLQAFLERSGWPVSIDTIKQSVRRGDLDPRAFVSLTPADIQFAERVYGENPQSEIGHLVAPGSPAAAALDQIKRRRRARAAAE